MSPEAIAAIGALLSGIGSALASIRYVRGARKRALDDCDKRMKAYIDGIREGRRHP